LTATGFAPPLSRPTARLPLRLAMKWIRFFGNFDGRIPRKTFWLANIAVFIVDVIVVVFAAAAVEAFAGETAGYVAMHIVTIAFFYPQFVIALKRAHDLDMSNQVIYAWYIALAVDYGVSRLAEWLWSNFDQNIDSLVGLAFVLVFITVVGLVTIVMLIELGFRRGTRGPNKYGPDPLAKT
jgi:uncharacterized membrane protein YhaH (DUF805 family)